MSRNYKINFIDIIDFIYAWCSRCDPFLDDHIDISASSTNINRDRIYFVKDIISKLAEYDIMGLTGIV
jgi:hypothetical protein